MPESPTRNHEAPSRLSAVSSAVSSAESPTTPASGTHPATLDGTGALLAPSTSPGDTPTNPGATPASAPPLPDTTSSPQATSTPPCDAQTPSLAAPILVSACLAGQPCRYDGRAKPDPGIIAMVEEGRAIPVCAEVLGGLPTPRPAAEIYGGDGRDVLAGRAHVRTAQGLDVSAHFIAGAREVARIAHEVGAQQAILQERSPSCGAGKVYDGTHSGTLVDGQGVLAALLREEGLDVQAAQPS